MSEANHGLKNEELFQEKLREAEAQKRKIELIMDQGGFYNYLSSLEDPQMAFAKADRLGCMDEGVLSNKIIKGMLGLAGSGILHPDREFLLQEIKKRGIRKITSHRGCGAAAIKAKEIGYKGDPDQLGLEFARDLALEAGIKHTHIEELERPDHFHVAQAAYVLGRKLPALNWNAAGLPAGFDIHLGVSGIGHTVDQVQVALNIAFGNHGLGELLTEENPFYIVNMIQNPDTLDQLQSGIDPLIKAYGNRVRVESFNPDFLFAQ